MNIVYVILSTVCLVIISATMLARANDLRWKKGLHWNTRLLGLIMAGFASLAVIGLEVVGLSTPSFYEVLLRIGITLVFVTTPYLPPYWKWISGIDKSDPQFSDDRRNKP